MGLGAILSSLFSSGASTVISAVGDAIDKNVTSDKERGEIKLALQASLQAFQLEMEKQATAQEEEITKRWQADAASDSWLAKNTRPLGFWYSLLITTGFAVADSAGYSIRDVWVELFASLTITFVVAYVGSRGLEKFGRTWKGDKR